MKKIDNFIKNLTNKYPAIIRITDKLSIFFDNFMIVYILLVMIIVFPVFLLFYFALPLDIRNEFSTIISALVSIIIVPFSIKIYEQKRESKKQRFNANYDIYLELMSILCNLVYNYENYEQNTNEFNNFIKTHYNRTCLCFTSELNTSLFLTYREYMNNNKENVIYYSNKCIRIIRKEGNVGKDFRHPEIIQSIMKK